MRGFAFECGTIVIKESELPHLQPDQVRIKTEFASFKQGTTAVGMSGNSPFHDKYFDPELRLFIKKSNYPQVQSESGKQVAYCRAQSVVGAILEVGENVSAFKKHDRVFCTAPICDIVTVQGQSCTRMTPPMNESDAVCVDPAFYALGGVKDARASIGDDVVIFGLGAIGLFGVQLLKLAGCNSVIAVDLCASRRDLAIKLGADAVLDPTACDVALEVRKLLGRGADIAIEYSGNYKALAEAIRSVRQCGRVVVVGYYQGKDSGLELGCEFFHNRIEIISSLPAWGNHSRDYPLWDNERLRTTIIEMFIKQSLNSREIVAPIVSVDEAASFFKETLQAPSKSVKFGIKFQ